MIIYPWLKTCLKSNNKRTKHNQSQGRSRGGEREEHTVLPKRSWRTTTEPTTAPAMAGGPVRRLHLLYIIFLLLLRSASVGILIKYKVGYITENQKITEQYIFVWVMIKKIIKFLNRRYTIFFYYLFDLSVIYYFTYQWFRKFKS